MIRYKNIRATTLNEFWGSDYDTHIYLWSGVKQNEIFKNSSKLDPYIMEDMFSSSDQIDSAVRVCKKKYTVLLSKLGNKLNEIHNVNVPIEFWEIAFGFWLFRQEK